MRDTVGQGLSDRGMTGDTFHRVRREKLLRTLTGGVAFRMTRPAPQFHPFHKSFLDFY